MKILDNFFGIKILIILFWLSIIILFLYSPLLKRNSATNSINVLTWGDMISLNTISRFEKETGIKVNLNYYETNEELFAKLYVTKAKEYDLMTIADNGLEFLNKYSLIKKIDKTKLNFLDDLDPHFYHHYYDPNFEYTIPYFWDLFGLGINKHVLTDQTKLGWNLIFDKKDVNGKISMTDDAYNAILTAAQYLYGTVKNITKEKLFQIKQTLLKQKKWVEIYTDLRNDYVLKHICPVVVTQSAYIYNVIKKDSSFEFILPHEGGFLIIDLLVIPKSSNKDELIYKFINFLYQEDIMRNHTLKLGYLPVLKSLLNTMDLSYLGGLDNLLSNDKFAKLEFLHSNLHVGEVTKIWTRIKS